MSICATTAVDQGRIFLRPRPFASSCGTFLLLPLLPRPVTKHLPAEIWTQILEYVYAAYTATSSKDKKLSLLLVCKSLKDVAFPLYYNHVHITTLPSLRQFTELLLEADKKWDSICRTPYSAPGRWVQTLDLSIMPVNLWADALDLDSLLTRLFPVLPFMSCLVLNSQITLSRRAIDSLCNSGGLQNLRVLKGIKLSSGSPRDTHAEPFLQVLRYCRNLEELSIFGSGLEAIHASNASGLAVVAGVPDGYDPLFLPRLSKLVLISMHTSPVMFALLHSPLPSLYHLTITPYDDTSVPSSLVPAFIHAHGSKLTSLHLYAPKSWPTMLFPSPPTLLQTCPKLYHLSLENPLPQLSIYSTYPPHPLQILSLPRPDLEFFRVLESLLPKLPCMTTVRAREVRWLRRGMTSKAQEAGVQGEMREWQRRLGKRGIKVVDADGILG